MRAYVSVYVLKVISVTFAVFSLSQGSSGIFAKFVERLSGAAIFFGWCAELWSGGRRTCRTCSYGPVLYAMLRKLSRKKDKFGILLCQLWNLISCSTMTEAIQKLSPWHCGL